MSLSTVFIFKKNTKKFSSLFFYSWARPRCGTPLQCDLYKSASQKKAGYTVKEDNYGNPISFLDEELDNLDFMSLEDAVDVEDRTRREWKANKKYRAVLEFERFASLHLHKDEESVEDEAEAF